MAIIRNCGMVFLGVLIGYFLFHTTFDEKFEKLLYLFYEECGIFFLLTSITTFWTVTSVSTSSDVMLFCSFKPLLIETLIEHQNNTSIAMMGLLDWQKPNQNNITLRSADFSLMLPSQIPNIGHVWYIVEPTEYQDDILQYDLSMRYQDNVPLNNTADSVLYNILTMFHKNVFIQTRFKPRGTIATLRAQNSEFLDVIFRCHAEFQLNNPPLLPFWFTPAQFQGQLIVTQNFSKIIKFNMSIPSDRKLNVDMEWINNIHENMEVGIGFIPEMLIQTSESQMQKEIMWDKEIPLKEAHELLAKKMFPFKEVLYIPIEKFLLKLNTQNKLLHCIILWGALDDQSC